MLISYPECESVYRNFNKNKTAKIINFVAMLINYIVIEIDNVILHFDEPFIMHVLW